MHIKVNCANNNYFTILLKTSIKYIDLYKYIAQIMNISPESILYIIYNGHLINNNILNEYYFKNMININNKYAVINIILINKNIEYLNLDYKILEDYITLTHSNIEENTFLENIPVHFKATELQNIIHKINHDHLLEIEKSNNCSICNNTLNGDIGLINCCHLFHYDCIYKYLLNYNIKCPNCNYCLK
jgi:hypothetical protein